MKEDTRIWPAVYILLFLVLYNADRRWGLSGDAYFLGCYSLENLRG